MLPRSTELCVLCVCCVVLCIMLPHLRSGWSDWGLVEVGKPWGVAAGLQERFIIATFLLCDHRPNRSPAQSYLPLCPEPRVNCQALRTIWDRVAVAFEVAVVTCKSIVLLATLLSWAWWVGSRMIRTYQHKLSSSTLVVRRVYTAGAHQRGSASYLSSRQRAMNKDTCNDKWVVYILQSKWVRTDDLGFSAFLVAPGAQYPIGQTNNLETSEVRSTCGHAMSNR